MNLNLTRRRFIKGVIASGAAATTTGVWVAANGAARPAGAVERMIRININGQVRTVDVAPQETLASTQLNCEVSIQCDQPIKEVICVCQGSIG